MPASPCIGSTITQAVFSSIRSSESTSLKSMLKCIGQQRSESISVGLASLDAQRSMSASMIGISEGNDPASAGKSFCKLQCTFNSFASGVYKITGIQGRRKDFSQMAPAYLTWGLDKLTINHQMGI